MQSDGAGKDDAELDLLHSQAANGIEHFGRQLRAVVLANALQHVRHFVPEEREAVVECCLHQIFDGARLFLFRNLSVGPLCHPWVRPARRTPGVSCGAADVPR